MKNVFIAFMLLFPIELLGNQYAVEDFFKDNQFEEIYLSPHGDYLAAVIAREGMSGIAILKTSDQSIYNFIRGDEDDVFRGIEWLSNTRIEVSLGHKYGSLDRPVHKGYITSDIDGKKVSKGTQGYILNRLPHNPDYMLTYFYDRGKPIIYKASKKMMRLNKLKGFHFEVV